MPLNVCKIYRYEAVAFYGLLELMVLNEQRIPVPQPRLPHPEAGEMFTRRLREFGALICKGPCVLGNGPVYAMPADASHPDTPGKIERIKGDARKGRPLALTIPFEAFLSHIDLAYIKDSRLKGLFSNPHMATQRFGGWTFIKMLSNKQARRELPPCVISSESGTVQDFSPAGHTTAEKFLGAVMMSGVRLPVMTSVNPSGMPEYVTEEEAQEFANEYKLPFLPNHPSWAARRKPKGSYPVLDVTADSLRVARQGFLSRGLMDALLAGLPVEWPENTKHSNYPESVLTHEDLPMHDRALEGPQLRAALLPHIVHGLPESL
jgi:hypothetical protein